MKQLNDWIIIELNNFVINGTLENRNHYTDKLLLLKDGYAVTESHIYKLGKIDKIWSTTQQAKDYLVRFT